MGRLFDHHAQCLTYPGELSFDPVSDTRWPTLDLTDFDPVRCFAWLFSARAHHFRQYTMEGFSHYSGGAPGAIRLPFAFSVEMQFEAFIKNIGFVDRPSQRQVLDAYLSSVFTGWLDYQRRYGAKRFVVAHAKRINWTDEASKFFGDYPDGFIISTVRAPASWYASARRHSVQLYGNIDDAISQWKANAENTAEVKRRWPERVAVISFERLIQDTEQTMKQIVEFLGLRYASTLCQSTFNGMPIESNSSFAPILKIDKATLDRAQHHLSPAERAFIEEAAGQTFDQISRYFL